MKVVSAFLLLFASMMAVLAHGSLRSTTSNSPQSKNDGQAGRELFIGGMIDNAKDAVGNAVDRAKQAVSDAMESVFAQMMPTLKDELGSVFIEELGNHMDPFSLNGHTQTYELEDLADLGNCTANGTVDVSITEISGTSSLKFNSISMEETPTYTATNYKVKWEGATFEIETEIEKIEVNGTYTLTITDCGLSVETSTTGSVEITGIKATFEVEVDGFSKYTGETHITDYEVKDFEIDTSEATVSGDTTISTTVSTSNGDYNITADISDSVESFVDDELEGTLKDVALTLMNDLAGDFLPVVIDSSAFGVSA
ncbi:expressed unknown protein [Seminavis robusta]|uniref:Uncharacterized protein n=1 Tax=Seminavis robusta TaxID=568900 RepID=A0A9N8DT35_9STRA|nr:expressed unknown protein [Seminavis robusta]|eukprot:Sro335_g120080.1 n/a (312) ;mRNA; r:37841-38776